MGILESILAEQQKTNEFLSQLIANGVVAGGEAGEDVKETTTKKTASKTKKDDKPAKPKHTKDEVVAAVVAVKDAFSAADAKAITAQFGLKKVADAKEADFDAIVAACQAKLAEKEGEEEEEEEI